MSKTLDQMTQNNWAYGGSVGFARYEFSDDFVDEDGRQFEAGPKSYLEVATTIVGSVVTVPAYPNFPETEAAITNNGVTVTCHLLDSDRVKRTTLFEDCRIYTSLPSTISLSQLVLANGASRLLRDTDVWTKEQVIDYVETRPPAAKATAVAFGNVRLSVPAVDPADPEVIGSNDPRLAGLGVYNRWVFASSVAAVDSNFDTGGGTDDTTALQTVLDTASATSPLTLVMDGVSLVSGLNIKSNTAIIGLNGGGFYLKSSSHRAVLRNANRSTSTRTDKNITLQDLRINANRAGQNKREADVSLVVGTQFFGVDNLTFRNVHVKDARNYYFHFGNVGRVRLYDLWAEGSNYDVSNHDGIHFNGLSSDIRIYGTRLTKTTDDGIALNAFDWLGYNGPFTINGPITDVLIDGVFCDACYFGVRVMANSSADYADRITVRNIHGSVSGYAWRLDSGTEYAGVGAGAIRQITFEDIKIQGFAGVGHTTMAAGLVESYVEHLVVRGFRHARGWFANYRPMMLVSKSTYSFDYSDPDLTGFGITGIHPGGTGDVKLLETDFSAQDFAGADTTGGGSAEAGYRVYVTSNVDRAILYPNLKRDASVTQQNGLIRIHGDDPLTTGVGELIIYGSCNRQRNTIALTGGRLAALTLNLTDYDSANSTIFIEDLASGITLPSQVTGRVLLNGGTLLAGADSAGFSPTSLDVDGRRHLTKGAALSIASNTIAPTSLIHHVGAGLIKTITVPNGFTAGLLHLIPDAAFTTDATGNISKASTAVVGQTMTFAYDVTADKWHPSY